MTAPILFLGTSFLGAIKQGYDHLFPIRGSATFVGFIAPELAANLNSGWSITDGYLHFAPEFNCFFPGDDQSIHSNSWHRTFPGTSKVSGLNVNLRNYRTIVFVDMFYRLRPPFTVNEKLFPLVNGNPISGSLLAELQVNGFNGWVSLAQHPQFGNVPFVNAKRLMTAIMEASGAASVFLLSAPRPPSGNLDIQARYGDVATARRSFDFLEQFYATELAHYGIEYLAQPLEVLDDDGCLTRAHFSRGAHPTKAGLADEHMNTQYGEVILSKYADKIMGIVQ